MERPLTDLEGFYSRLPVSLQNLGCSLEGLRIQQRRFGAGFHRQLKLSEERSAWSLDNLIRYRDERLREFVIHSAGTVPYYSRLFREIGIDPGEIRTLDDLSRLPILTKEQVQQSVADFTSNAVQARQRIVTHTSGTTGAGLRFSTTREAQHEQWAVWWRYRHSHGLDQNQWCGYFGGRSVVPVSVNEPPFWRYNYAGRQILFSGYHMSPRNLGSYVDELRRKRPPWLHGYPSLIALLGSFLLDSQCDLGYQPRWITVGAENLLPQQARLIEDAFGVRPGQHYGMAEAVANFSECTAGALHVDEDFAAVEFVRDPAGDGWRIVGSNFSNPATPLLRYDVGDIASVSEFPCLCGRPGRVVESVDGRLEDYVILANGTRVGRLDHVFKDMVTIREAQIAQHSPGEITLRIVRGAEHTEADEEILLREMRKRVGFDIRIEIVYLDRLPRSGSGKLRLVVSSIREGRIARV